MSRLAAWCPKGAKMATADEYSGCAVPTPPTGVLRWRCPLCKRLLKIGESRGENCDRKGWHGTLGPRWPRHYSWAAPIRKS